MKSRLIMLMSLAIAALSVSLAAGRFTYTLSPPPPVHASLKASLASYLGVYEAGVPASYRPVDEFAEVAGRQPNLVGYYSGWAEPFKIDFAQEAHSHGAIPFVQIDPTGASVPAIAAGVYDTYLRNYADEVRDYGHPVVIGFGHEMNAPWYSWGYGHLSSATFVAAWRHLVRLFRQQGADNVTWIWTIQADEPGTGPIASWWPGSKYVTWVGIDGFYYRQSDTFASVFGRTITQVRRVTTRPVLLSETAVGPGQERFRNIAGLFQGVVASQALGLVWFDVAQDHGPYHQNWRIEDSGSAEEVFSLAVKQDIRPAPPGT
jgi:mannan endo-1,4-beta-mannosidase